MLPAFFSTELAVMSTRNMIAESRVSSKKSLDVQNSCVFVAKHIVVLINRLTSTSLAAKDSIKEQWKSVAMVDQCQKIAKFSRRQSTLLQPIEDFERFSIVLLRRTNKERTVFLSSKNISRSRRNTHKTLTLVSFNYSFKYLYVFIHSNYLFQTNTQSFHIALTHILIRKRKIYPQAYKLSARAGPAKNF